MGLRREPHFTERSCSVTDRKDALNVSKDTRCNRSAQSSIEHRPEVVKVAEAADRQGFSTYARLSLQRGVLIAPVCGSRLNNEKKRNGCMLNFMMAQSVHTAFRYILVAGSGANTVEA